MTPHAIPASPRNRPARPGFLPMARGLQARLDRIVLRSAFDADRRIEFYRQLSHLLEGGLSEERALEVLERAESRMGRKPRRALARLIRLWRTRIVRDGVSLTQAMAPWLPPLDRLMLGAANPARLPEALREAAATAEAIRRLRSVVIKKLSYPAFLFVFAILILYVAAAWLVPAFTTIVPIQWTGPAALIVAISDFIQDWGLPLIVALLGGLALLWFSLSRWTGRGRVLADRLPPWSIHRIFTGAVWMQSLSALLVNPDILEALRHTHDMGSPYLRSRVAPLIRQVRTHGRNLVEALSQARQGFPDERLIATLAAYVETGDPSAALHRLARTWMESAERSIVRQADILRSLAFLAAAGSIGLTGYGYTNMILQMQQAMSSTY